MTEMVDTLVNGRWTIKLPRESHDTPGWSWWERDTLAYLHAVIRPGDVVWEVGAEKGYLAALYTSWGAKVVRVEPDDAANEISDDVFRANRLLPMILWTKRLGAEGDTLDWLQLHGGHPWPNVVSIDVEGAEYQVLLGGELVLSEVRPIIHVAVHPEVIREKYGDTPDDVLCHLEKHNYDVHYLGYDHERHYLCKPRP